MVCTQLTEWLSSDVVKPVMDDPSFPTMDISALLWQHVVLTHYAFGNTPYVYGEYHLTIRIALIYRLFVNELALCMNYIIPFAGYIIVKISHMRNICVNTLHTIFITVGDRTVALKIIAHCSITQTPTGQSKVWWWHARKMVVIYFKRI